MWFVPLTVVAKQPYCNHSRLLKAIPLHTCMLLSFRLDAFSNQQLSDLQAQYYVAEQDQPSKRQFYFNCYLPFLPVPSLFLYPLSKSTKKCKRTDRKTIAFQIELPAEYVHFLNLTSLPSQHMAEGGGGCNKEERERERGGGRPSF